VLGGGDWTPGSSGQWLAGISLPLRVGEKIYRKGLVSISERMPSWRCGERVGNVLWRVVCPAMKGAGEVTVKLKKKEKKAPCIKGGPFRRASTEGRKKLLPFWRKKRRPGKAKKDVAIEKGQRKKPLKKKLLIS